MNPDELLELTTIISMKEFEGEVYAKSIIETRDKIGEMVFKVNTLLVVQEIDINQKKNDDGSDTWTWIVRCTLKNKKFDKRFEKIYVLPEVRNPIIYEGYYIEIKSPELESGFHIVSHYQYKKIDIYNKIHRKYILKQYIFYRKELFPLDDDFKKIILECYDKEYALPILNKGDFYELANKLFENYLKDLNSSQALDNLFCLNQN
jgi:hypothetical protein